MSSRHVRDTLAYYDQHTDAFIERTAERAMEHVYTPFLALIPERGRILDAGCGSGRDAAAFAARGYRVTAFDGSPKMARRASERTGLTVRTLTFDAVDWHEEFDPSGRARRCSTCRPTPFVRPSNGSCAHCVPVACCSSR